MMVPFCPLREASTMSWTFAKTSAWLAACGKTHSYVKLLECESPVKKLRLVSEVGDRQCAGATSWLGLRRMIVLQDREGQI